MLSGAKLFVSQTKLLLPFVFALSLPSRWNRLLELAGQRDVERTAKKDFGSRTATSRFSLHDDSVASHPISLLLDEIRLRQALRSSPKGRGVHPAQTTVRSLPRSAINPSDGACIACIQAGLAATLVGLQYVPLFTICKYYIEALRLISATSLTSFLCCATFRSFDR